MPWSAALLLGSCLSAFWNPLRALSSSASLLPGAVFSSNAASSWTFAIATTDSADAGPFLVLSATSTGIVGPVGAPEPPQNDLDLPLPTGMLTSLVGSPSGIGPIGLGCLELRLHPTPAAI